MPGPPPPPPLPGMGRGAGGPPPPPLPSVKKAPAGAGRGALLSSIEQGARLKKVTKVNDRSAPLVGNVSDGPPVRPGGAPPVPGGAPPVPGMHTRPSGLAPPVPPGSRGRSNSDGGDGGSMSGPPQLAGILAGGMPKLRKVGGNVNTGADNHAAYLSDPETVMRAPPVPPSGSAPTPPTVAQLRSNLRPSSVTSFRGVANKPRPAPPTGKKPPIPPPSSRKPSGSHTPSLPASAPPVPPSAAPRPPERSTPAPPPVSNGSHLPSLAQQAARNAFNRSAPPPPKHGQDDDYDPYNYGAPPSRLPPPPAAPPARPLAAAPPPRPLSSAPPPPPSLPPSSSGGAPLPPPPPASAPRPPAAAPSPPRSMLDVGAAATPLHALAAAPAGNGNASTAMLTSNGNRSSSMTTSTARTNSSFMAGLPAPAAPVRVQDSRWRFQDEGLFPAPRRFGGGTKKYRAGRVSSVPLDLRAFE